MVDCGNTRCSQEKKSFKKELMSWSKKIPLIVELHINQNMNMTRFNFNVILIISVNRQKKWGKEH
ncbi:hypothetical protein KUTeg_005477 [Tegillarca granosa]|uniref:Uncharacterized protein n=1 Tax=Tegillarca granosa TaxID=220873 RepID=A0ABQ9FJT2_TEGGR|nr:hypothetical protein KUTeg_005477 [Tegillarca granosa]